jgi:drug/metabolite transporter (DMT)-like permease
MASASDYLKLHVVVFLWGTTSVMAKLVSMPATEMLAFRTLLAALGLLVLALWTKTQLKHSTPDILRMLGIGIVVGLHWVAFFVGGQFSTASHSLVGFATCSLWAAVLEPVSKGQRVRPLEIILGLVVLAGITLIFRLEFHYWLGFLLSVFSGLLAAVFSIMNARLVNRIPSTAIAFYEMTGAFLFVAALLPVYQLTYSTTGILDLTPEPMDWLWLFILSMFCSVFAFTMSVHLLKKLSVFTVQLLLNLEPIYGIVLAILVLNEHDLMGTGFVAGTLLILSAVLSYPWLKARFN